MKKAGKIALIVGLVLILVGTGVSTAAFALGANPVRISEFFEERFNSYGIGGSYEEYHRYYEADRSPYEEPYSPSEFSVNPEDSFEAPEEENGDAPVFFLSYGDISEIEIKQKGGNVIWEAMEGISELEISSYVGSPENVSFYEERGQLTLRVYPGETYRLAVPAQWILKKAEIEVGGEGTFEGIGFQVRYAELDAEHNGDIMIGLSPELLGGNVSYFLELEGGYAELPEYGGFAGYMEERFAAEPTPDGAVREPAVFEISTEDDGNVIIQ